MSTTKRLEQADYDERWANQQEGYSAANIGYTSNFLKFMDQHLPPLKGASGEVLEVGCGDGFFSQQLSQRGWNVTGIDLSPVGVAKAQQRVPNGKFFTHDLDLPLPFADQSFAAIWCSEVLEHLFSPLSVLVEMRRVLKSDGRLLVTVPYHGLLKNLGIALLAFDRHYDPTYPHIRFFTRNTIAQIARQAGLQIEQLTTCGSNLGIRDWLVPTNILMAAKPA